MEANLPLNRSYTFLNGNGYYPIRYRNVNDDSDTTLPDGELTSPDEGATITSGTLQISGWASDSDSGFDYAQVWATWDDGSSWHQVGGDYTSSPFSYNWDMCAAGVPTNAQVALGLDIWDNAGNKAQSPRGWRRFTKN